MGSSCFEGRCKDADQFEGRKYLQILTNVDECDSSEWQADRSVPLSSLFCTWLTIAKESEPGFNTKAKGLCHSL